MINDTIMIKLAGDVVDDERDNELHQCQSMPNIRFPVQDNEPV